MSNHAALAARRAPIVIANDNRGATAFIVEVGDTAAGVVVREGRKYQFFAAHADFRTLEGTHFTTPGAAQKAAEAVRAARVRTSAEAHSSVWGVLTL